MIVIEGGHTTITFNIGVLVALIVFLHLSATALLSKTDA
jgi:hypothetical protein